VERLYRRIRGREARVLREDFCGTAGLACGWALRAPDHVAYGVDLDPEPLAWARAHRLARMRAAAERVHLVQGDVLHARVPPADVTLAYNFSFWVFHERSRVRAYFRAARRGLARDGVLLLEMFGGTGAATELVETRRIVGRRGPDGEALPAFRYVWEHERFNPVTHRLEAAIHFDLPGGRRLRRAFRYDWRLWSLPEVRELLAEAGFRSSEVHLLDAGDAAADDDVYRRREHFRNRETWLAIVAGVK
jgi:SAM-dependent methyltransferase